MIRRIAVAAFAALAALPASAAVMEAVYTGTVFDSLNETGAFGATGPGSLDGLSYVLTFRYDTDIGFALDTTQAGVLSAVSVFGGPGTSQPAASSPILASSIEINAVRRDVDGRTDGVASLERGGRTAVSHVARTYVLDDGAGNGSTADLVGQVIGPGLVFPLDLEAPFSLAGLDPGLSQGLFSFFRTSGGITVDRVQGSLRHDTLTVSRIGGDVPDPAAVPLPASLLLLGALGGLGLVRRRAG